MKFSPNTILPAGTYDFVVKKALDKISKAGNEMLELELEVYSAEQKSKIFDYLLESTAYKLKHFCDVVGLNKEYEAGSIGAEMCLGRQGRCEIDIQIDKLGKYPDKNLVKDYLKSEELPF